MHKGLGAEMLRAEQCQHTSTAEEHTAIKATILKSARTQGS